MNEFDAWLCFFAGLLVGFGLGAQGVLSLLNWGMVHRPRLMAPIVLGWMQQVRERLSRENPDR